MKMKKSIEETIKYAKIIDDQMRRTLPGLVPLTNRIRSTLDKRAINVISKIQDHAGTLGISFLEYVEEALGCLRQDGKARDRGLLLLGSRGMLLAVSRRLDRKSSIGVRRIEKSEIDIYSVEEYLSGIKRIHKRFYKVCEHGYPGGFHGYPGGFPSPKFNREILTSVIISMRTIVSPLLLIDNRSVQAWWLFVRDGFVPGYSIRSVQSHVVPFIKVAKKPLQKSIDYAWWRYFACDCDNVINIPCMYEADGKDGWEIKLWEKLQERQL